MLGKLTAPIRDLESDEPYPMGNLKKRLDMLEILLEDMHELADQLSKIESK